MHYTCIACITIDSVLRIDEKNHLQVCLDECKYRSKKLSRFINTELKSDSQSSDSDLESEKTAAKVDNELMAKFEKCGSDNDSEKTFSF